MTSAGQKKLVEVAKLVSKIQKDLNKILSIKEPVRKLRKEKVATSAGSRAGRPADPNSMSQLVRTYFEKYGFDHPLKEVAETLTKKHGKEFTVGLVANIKHRIGGTNHRESTKATKVKAKTVKAKSAKTKPEVSKKEVAKKEKVGPSLSKVVAQILASSPEGLKLSEITEKVKNSDYQYRGGKEVEGLRSNVWQCLNKLKKEGSHKGYEGEQPIVLHNANDKKYLINPKATPRKVA